MKMSNNTNGRPSALPPELSTDRPRASDRAPSTVILLALSGFSEGLALSHFCEGSPAPLPHVGPAAAAISHSSSAPSAFVCVFCVKSFAFRSAACPQNRQFLFDTNEPLPNFATRTKQTTSHVPFVANRCLSHTPTLQFTQNKSLHHNSRHFFYSTQMNGHYSRLTNHYAPITTHQSLLTTRRNRVAPRLPCDEASSRLCCVVNFEE